MTAVSVVIPCYNRAHLIARSLESALSQTLAPAEIVVVDDCSTDATREVLREWQSREPRVRPVFQALNQGPAGARNRGVAEAKCELVAFLDSDDLWRPGHLESCVGFLERDRGIDLAFADVRRATSDGQVLQGAYLREQKRISQFLAPTAVPGCHRFATSEWQVLLRNYVVPVQTTVIRRAVAAAFPFDTAIRGPEDYDFFLRLARAGRRFGFLDAVHCDCLIHGENLLSNGRAGLHEAVEMQKVWRKVLADDALSSADRSIVAARLAAVTIDEGYACRLGGRRRRALSAYWRSIRLKPSARAFKGLLGSALAPRQTSGAESNQAV